MGDLLIPVAAVVAALFFARGFGRLRARRPDGAGWDRAALWAAGLLAGTGGVLLLHGAAEERASAHMIQHVLLGDLAPALVLVALRGRLLFAVVPKPVQRLFALRLVRALLRPGPSLAGWAALLWFWHIPVVYDAALSLWGSLGYALGAMVIAQMLVWVLVLSYRPLYAYGSATDQSLAGLVMAVEQFLTLGAFTYVRLRAHFRAPLALADGHPLRV